MHLHRAGRPPVVLSGQAAQLISELVAADGPMSWEALARERVHRRDRAARRGDAERAAHAIAGEADHRDEPRGGADRVLRRAPAEAAREHRLARALRDRVDRLDNLAH